VKVNSTNAEQVRCSAGVETNWFGCARIVEMKFAHETASHPVVRTESGLVSGFGGSVRVFKGIPYAAPPVGDLRWRPPAPPLPWQGVRRADAFGADCPQAPSPRTRAPGMDEDCLTLNIWAPDLEPGATAPVMVWLYGGSYVAGSASDPRCDGESFARKGVVLVAINYRVGLFGFFAHPALTAESPHGSSGNYGLLDTLAALGWVQRNIAGFGGDPERVTLFGVSAGSASISLLLTAELARGRFARTIQQSPGAFRPLAGLAQAEQAGLQLGTDIAALRRLPAEEVLRATPLFVPKMRGLTVPRVLRPIRDGWVIRQDEREAYAAGAILQLPSIVGSNADEGTKLTAGWTVSSPEQLDALLAETFGDGAPRARALYGQGANVRASVAALFADTQFNSGARGVARGLAAAGAPVYRYLFTRRRPGCGDPNHGDEVPYVFASLRASSAIEPAPFDAADEALAETMQDAWVRFAHNADPNGGSLPAWPTTLAGEDYLVLNERISVGQGWRREQLDFIDAHFAAAARPGG
jgi:para-nitrobenzyl esterase